jgi:hypothetical protein
MCHARWSSSALASYGRVEAFGEPAINWCEEIAGFGGFPLVAPEAGELKSCNLLRRGQLLQHNPLWGANTDPARLGIDNSSARRSCWNEGGGGAGVAIAGLSHWGNFQAKGAANRGKPLSAPAVSGAAASASEASPERRRSALLDSGKSMVQRLA